MDIINIFVNSNNLCSCKWSHLHNHLLNVLPQILLFLLLNSSEYTLTLISTLKYHPKIINSRISSSRTVKNCIAKKAQPFQALSTLFPIFMNTGHTVNNYLISLKSSQKGSLLHQLSGEKQNYCSLSLIQLHLFFTKVKFCTNKRPKSGAHC